MRSSSLAMLDFAGIRLFDRIASRASIASAARDLGMTPSSATRKLIAMEEVLGVRLFNRSTRRMALTEAGRATLDWAQGALGSLDLLADDMAAITGSPSGRIRIAAPHFGMNHYLPAIFASFSRKFPRIALEIVTTDCLINLIEDGYDVVVRYGYLPDSRMIGTRIAEFTKIMCASPDYLAEWGTPQTISDLKDHQIIVHRQSDLETWAFRQGDQIHHQPIVARIAVDHSHSVDAFCSAGAGIARLTLPTTQTALDSGRLVQILTDYECVEAPGEEASLWIVHLGRELPHRVRLLVDHLKHELPIARAALYS